ncbi:MAG: molybdopterin-dependent oxidoreductase [Jatrophihabitans sp.]|uniref:molybdopterin-dependent oxidoreductase n=1 Tax=Jatrophihabitans sp. TaxID=1932789 RepID=UPI003F81D51B
MERATYCRICEPTCGLIATVEDGKLIGLRPDKDHPVTRGFSCPKGIEFVHVQNDPDRLLHPQRRRPDGTFERITWETALREIGERLRDIRARHGGASIGWYAGNPSAFSHSHAIWSAAFVRGLGSRHLYTANTQDTSSRFVASALLYGSPTIFPLPDLLRTDFLLMVGANPLVSRGSIVAAGNLREKLTGIVQRGGRVVVVDPRRTETARAFEHVAVRPDADAWLLLGMLHVLFAEGLTDEAAIARQTRGIDGLRALALTCPPETAAARCGVPAERIVELARAFAGAPSATAYGRTGACLGTRPTLVNVLLDALNVVTGNLDRPGGSVFARPPIDFSALAHRGGIATYDTYRSRVGGLPEVIGQLPAPLMAPEITTPGPGQLRALIVSAGNPVLSVPGSRELEAALPHLELQVGIDLYVNETHKHADYLLPAATFYERDDLPLPLQEIQLTPFVQWTEAVVPPRGEARPDWQIIEALARELGFAPLSGAARFLAGDGLLGRALTRAAAPLARRVTPQRAIDALLRAGRDGDRFGLRRGGLSLAALRAKPHGVVLADTVETGVLRRRLTHRDKRVHLDDPRITAELADLLASPPPDDGLLMIGRREVRSHNSWMHNTPKHRDATRRQRAQLNRADADAAGIADGDVVRVVSATGAIELPAELTDDLAPGVVSVPHGWGHEGGGWTVANAAGGANVNAITPGAPETLERLSGMTHLNGVPVRIERVDVPAPVVGDEVAAPA